MGKIMFWILISVVFGAIAGLISVSFSRRKGSKRTSNTTIEADADVADVEGSANSNMLLVATVFSILAFLVIWLVSAVLNHGVQSW